MTLVRVKSIVAALLAAILVSGCASTLARNAPPERLVGETGLAGMPNIRVWADAQPDVVRRFLLGDAAGWRTPLEAQMRSGMATEFNIVAISGGADAGAFGAGLIVGWGDAGTRPAFDVVTGVSVGALIAPFVFLGRSREFQLREIFNNHSRRDIFSPSIMAPLFGSSLLDSRPLESLIAKYVDQRFLEDVARERDKGRILLIGTTNLDAQRAVLWDMGRIAQSNHPEALILFRKVLLASTAIPGAFPPVRIRVSANGSTFEELHVDGGISQQVFVPPPSVFTRDTGPSTQRMTKRIFVVRNDKIHPEWEAVEAGMLSISARSITTLIKNQGIGDLYRIYAAARRDDMEFNLAAIPADVDIKSERPFEQRYMRALYDVGYRAGFRGTSWMKWPPGMSATVSATRPVSGRDR